MGRVFSQQVFTALHCMQRGIENRKAVCPSVCLSVRPSNTCTVTKRKHLAKKAPSGVTLWLHLTFDPLTLKMCGRSGVMWSNYVPNLIEIDQSANDVIDDLANFFKGGFLNSTHQRGGPNCTRFGTNRVPSSLHQIRYFGSYALLRFEMRAAQRRVVSKIEAKFHTFWPLPL